MKYLASLLALVVLYACTNSPRMTDEELKTYSREVDAWHLDRINTLRSEEGWLNLAGLFWLSPGINTLGTGEDQDIRFPEGSIPVSAGVLLLNNGKVTARFSSSSGILVNGQQLSEAIVFDKDSVKKMVMESGTYRWTIIKREDKYGIRLRDLAHPRLEKFKGIERFELNPEMKFEATLMVADTIKTIPITNVLGQTTQQYSPGTIRFTFEGKSNTLDLIDEGDGGDYFIVFGDKTNGKTTYDAGRFLYVKRPGADGMITLDFNKSFNPPCAFSPFATCPLPPLQNILDLMIEAGEKKVHLD